MKRWTKLLLAAALLFSVVSASAETDTPSAHPQQRALLTTPETLVSLSPDDYVVTAGFVYYSQSCQSPLDATLNRRPTRADRTTQMRYVAVNGGSCFRSANPPVFVSMTADEDGVYYYNRDSGFIEMQHTHDPTGTRVALVSTQQPLSNLEVFGDYLYWASYDNTIRRVPKTGGSVTTIANTTGAPTDVEPSNFTISWSDDAGLRSVSAGCNFPCTTINTISSLPSKQIRVSKLLPISTYFVSTENGQDSIRHHSCQLTFPFTCSTETWYTAPANNFIRDFLLADGSVYWLEAFPGETRLRRMPIGGGTIEDLQLNMNVLVNRLFHDEIGIYFQYSGTISRLLYTATAIERDLAVDAWEVTQSVQRLANDVPLIARKPTFVRVYGRQNAGPDAQVVDAVLHGSRNGSPLPGSPLQPFYGREGLSVGGTYDRGDRDAGWLFQLPDSWITSGTINLRAVVDPLDIYNDSDRSDNEMQGNFTFDDEPEACLIHMPVRTNHPRPSLGDPNVPQMLDRYVQLWPIPGVRTFWQSEPIEELEVCWAGPFPYPCFGPLELDQGWGITNGPPDKDKAMGSLILRTTISDDPNICDDTDASTHYSGMVNPSAGGPSGYANYVFHSSYTKNPWGGSAPTTNAWRWPTRASTLAQETAHNYWREHVDCGNPGGVDNNYPYPTCQLDNQGNSNHYGFDVQTRTPIAPTVASDFMSYNPTSGQNPQWIGKWVSDYTYEALKDKFGRSTPRTSADRFPEAATAVAQAEEIVFISGMIDPNFDRGELGYAHVMSNDALSRGVREKWVTHAAPEFSAENLAGEPHIHADGSTHYHSREVLMEYHVRLIGTDDAVLVDHHVGLLPPDNHGEVEQYAPFVATFPAPSAEVARIELLSNNKVLASLSPGTAKPSLAIDFPTGGETFDSDLTIKWQAGDADKDDFLRYHVHYSPDNGQNWYALASDYVSNPLDPAVTLTLNDMSAVPSSADNNTGLLRITATDGYNTVTQTSSPFTIVNRAPTVEIIAPHENVWFSADSTIPLRAIARDIEDGTLSGSALAWTVGGVSYGTGSEQNVAGLRPGDYTVEVTATDSQGDQDSAQTTLHIDDLSVPFGGFPLHDGYCDDAVYEGGTTVRLEPYSDGSQASVTMLQTSSALYVCFTGLPYATGINPSSAGFHVDVDNSGHSTPQADDYFFQVREDGTPITQIGNGSSYTTDGSHWSCRTGSGDERPLVGRNAHRCQHDWGHRAYCWHQRCSLLGDRSGRRLPLALCRWLERTAHMGDSPTRTNPATD